LKIEQLEEICMAGIFGIKDKHVTGLEMCVLFENERYRMNGREVVSKQRI